MFNHHVLARYVYLNNLLLEIAADYMHNGTVSFGYSARYMQDAALHGAACMVHLHAECDNAWEPELAVFA